MPCARGISGGHALERIQMSRKTRRRESVTTVKLRLEPVHTRKHMLSRARTQVQTCKRTTYVHAYIHTYKHEYISTIRHTYIHTCMHAYIHAYCTCEVCAVSTDASNSTDTTRRRLLSAQTLLCSTPLGTGHKRDRCIGDQKKRCRPSDLRLCTLGRKQHNMLSKGSSTDQNCEALRRSTTTALVATIHGQCTLLTSLLSQYWPRMNHNGNTYCSNAALSRNSCWALP